MAPTPIMLQQPSKMESLTTSTNSTINGVEGGGGGLTSSPDKSSSSSMGPSPAFQLPKNPSSEKKIMNPDRRHYRSSSLENNIFMSNLSPFTGHNQPQHHHHRPHSGSGATTPANIANNKSHLSIAAVDPIRTPTMTATSQSPAASRRRSGGYQPLAPSPQYQPMSLGHQQSSLSTTPINNGEMHGHLQSPSSSASSLSATTATYQPQNNGLLLLGGHHHQPTTTTAYYGTLKSKREQKRMQMSSQKGGMGAFVVGHHHQQQHHHHPMIGGGLQARISSVDDLRPGHSNSITKSQVRLMRDMFEQQQQQNNGSSGVNKAKAKTAEENHNHNSSSSSKQTSGGGGGGGGPDAEEEVALSKPPAIQPCSGVLEMNKQQLIKPIAFKPIPFPADSRFNLNNNSHNNNSNSINNGSNNYDRYGSTPSLNPPINYNLKFGSTHDLRPPHHHFNTIGSRKAYAYNNLHNYDSMESISPDSICSSQSTLKSMSYHTDLLDTPSPSGVSELEAALRDRDSEVAYLRHTMEHNEKVIFRVHQDKERNWEEEIKRMRLIHAQRIQKFEQIAMMQSFQLRQAKKRHQEEATLSQERIKDLERKVELQNNELMGHKVNEKELREQCSDMIEENELLRKLVNELRHRLEESEWTNCQKNGETALLKTQLKDAQSEVIIKDQEIAQLRRGQYGDHLILPSNDSEESPIIITSHPSVSSSSSSSSPSSPVSINHSDDEKLKDDLQFSHLNRIIILKDQIIMAMTNEIQKLRKEVSDLGLFNSYEGLPPGRGTCNGNNNEMGGGVGGGMRSSTNEPSNNNNNVKIYTKDNNVILGDYHDLLNNLKNSEDFLKCSAQQKPTLEELKNVLLNNQFGNASQSGMVREKVAINHLSTTNSDNCDDKLTSGGGGGSVSVGSSEPKRTNLETVAAAAANKGDDDVAKLRTELLEIKQSFDAERKKWTEEKEKVLVYQRQLQRNYLQMCKKNESLEQRLLKNTFNEVAI